MDTQDALDKIDDAVSGGNIPVVDINVSDKSGVSEVVIDPAVAEKLAGIPNSGLTFTTVAGTVILSREALSGLDLTSGDIGIAVRTVDVPSEYSDLGITAVYDLAVSYAGSEKPVQFGTDVDARMPYTPAPGEDTSKLKVYCLKGYGAVEAIDGYYDGGYIWFSTTHFSMYATLPYTAASLVILDKTSVTLDIGNTVKLTATVIPSEATFKTVTWTSSDASIASVSHDGTVIATKAGTVTIKAIADGKEAVCTVIVNSPVFTVTFNANGGSCSVPSMKTIDGKLASLPAATRDGYAFGGWYTQAEGGEEIKTSYVFIRNTTVYAHWTETPSPEPTPSSGGGIPVIAIVGAVLAIIAVACVAIFLKKRSETP